MRLFNFFLISILITLTSSCLIAQDCDFGIVEVDALPTVKICKDENDKIDCTIEKINEILTSNLPKDFYQLPQVERIDLILQIKEDGSIEQYFFKDLTTASPKHEDEIYNNSTKNVEKEDKELHQNFIADIVNLFPKFNAAQKDNSNVCSELQLTLKYDKHKLVVNDYCLGSARMPVYKGCEHILNGKERADCTNQKLVEFVVSNLKKCPKKARRKRVTGNTVVRFMVARDGSIKKVTTVKSLGYGCDEEARRVVSIVPDFVPAFQNGKPVAVYFNLPIKFNCTD